MKRLVISGFLVVSMSLLAWASFHSPSIAQTAAISPWLPQASAEAQKWKADAQLVEIELRSFGFATDPKTGIPDMTKSGPPAGIIFDFYSPSAHDGIRVDVTTQEIPEQAKEMMKKMGQPAPSPLKVEHFPNPWSAYTLPIPDGIDLDYEKAIEIAKKDIADECKGEQTYGNCRIVSQMELHMFWSGRGDKTGRPVWTVEFGQNPTTLKSVKREVDAEQGAVIAFDPAKPGDQQESMFGDETPKPLHNVSVTLVEPGFIGLWKGINAAVQQQDPLYQPYAVSLATNVRSWIAGDRGFGEMYVQYFRNTPSLAWDDMTAHLEGRGKTLNVIFEAPEKRTTAKPVGLQPDKLPDPDATLARLAGVFPKGYAEIYYTDYKGCTSQRLSDTLIKQTCGVVMQQEHRTDKVHFWLIREGNPWWSATDSPIQTEHEMVAKLVPKNDWVWWTRIKHPNEWRYYIVDAKSGQPFPNLCTNPNNGQNDIQYHQC